MQTPFKRYIPFWQFPTARQLVPDQVVPAGQLVMFVAHFEPSKKVPAGQLFPEVAQTEPFQKVPGGHWMGAH